MKSLFTGYQIFLDGLEKASLFAVLVAMAALFLVVATGIVTDQLFGSSLVWVEEVSNLLFAWVVFPGAGIITRHGGHIGVTMLYDVLGKNMQAILRIIYAVLGLIIAWVMVYYGIKMAQFVGRSQMSLYLSINLFWYYLSVPVGGVLLGLNAIGAALPGADNNNQAHLDLQLNSPENDQ